MMLELTHYGGVAPVKPLRINTQFLYRAGESDPPPLSICIMSSRRPVAIETRLKGEDRQEFQILTYADHPVTIFPIQLEPHSNVHLEEHVATAIADAKSSPVGV